MATRWLCSLIPLVVGGCTQCQSRVIVLRVKKTHRVTDKNNNNDAIVSDCQSCCATIDGVSVTPFRRLVLLFSEIYGGKKASQRGSGEGSSSWCRWLGSIFELSAGNMIHRARAQIDTMMTDTANRHHPPHFPRDAQWKGDTPLIRRAVNTCKLHQIKK